MASFDIFCEPHMGCVKTAVAEANAIALKRHDWQDTGARYSLKAKSIVLTGRSHQQLDQMLKELCFALRRQRVSLAFIGVKRPTVNKSVYSARLTIECGITRDWSDYLIETMNQMGVSAKYSYQNGEIHVVTDHIDDAQQLIAHMRARSFDIPIHYRNLEKH